MTFPDLAALKDFAGWKAARAPRAPGPAPDAEHLRAAYLDLLKLALCDLAGTSTTSVSAMLDGSVASRELRGDDRRLRAAGMDWPLHGLTMVGLHRLDDLQACVESVVADGVEGDVIEAGTWRGGASILMRATLDSLGATDATVCVADSFQGFPAAAADEVAPIAHDFLAVPPTRYARASRASGSTSGVELRPRLLRGDAAGARRPRAGPSCGSTPTPTRRRGWRSSALYPRPGGRRLPDRRRLRRHAEECRRAVDEFRAEHGIAEPLEQVDWTCVRWRRESDAPIEPPPPPRPTRRRAGPPARAGAPHVPTGRERELEHERRRRYAEQLSGRAGGGVAR